jgi:hypothetical protein
VHVVNCTGENMAGTYQGGRISIRTMSKFSQMSCWSMKSSHYPQRFYRYGQMRLLWSFTNHPQLNDGIKLNNCMVERHTHDFLTPTSTSSDIRAHLLVCATEMIIVLESQCLGEVIGVALQAWPSKWATLIYYLHQISFRYFEIVWALCTHRYNHLFTW